MPPPKSHKKLTAAQKETLQALGRRRRRVPAALVVDRARNGRRCRRSRTRPGSAIPIDRFILAELEKHGLQPGRRGRPADAGPPAQPRPDRPAAGAGRRRGVRQRHSRPTLTRSYVDRLLASPHWGEHRGRYWLDAARYADTHGIHFDNYREIWAYRDWVIDAFNRNMPFDQFTIEQLAGDLLPNRTLDQQVASGFNRCNITTNEGGAIPEEYLVLYTRDRTETTSQVWLGLTAGCAVCHDHKFDPLSQKEFYSLSAFFNNTTQARHGRQHQGHAAGDAGAAAGGPAALGRAWRRSWPRPASRPRPASKPARADFDKWLADGQAAQSVAAPVPGDGLRFTRRSTRATGKTVAVTVDGKPRSVTLDAGLRLGRRARRRQGVQEPAGRHARAAPTRATSRRTRRSPTAPGSSSRRACRPAPCWPAWTTSTTSAAGTCGSRATASAPTSSTSGPTMPSRWSSKNPVKPGQWNHVFVTYDGSGKAAGVKSTSTAGRRRRRSRPTSLQEHHPHDGAAEDRPAAHARPAWTAWCCRTCASTAARWRRTEVDRLATATPRRLAGRQAGGQAHRGGEERSCSTGGCPRWTRRTRA